MSPTALLSRPEVTVVSPVGYRKTSPLARVRDQGFLSESLGDSPWKTGDVVRLVSRVLLGLVGLVLTWVGCSGTLDFRDQAGWTAGAVLGLVVAATAGFTWVLSGLGTVGKERRYLRALLRELYLPAVVAVVTAPAGNVTADGMQRYHRPDCDLVRGKPARPLREDPADADLKPCGMCLS